MKKGRPAHTLSVLCLEHQAEDMLAVIFAGTSSIGVRGHPVTKHALARAWLDIEVSGGTVVVKIAHRAGTIVQVTPEFDSVAEVAATRSISPRVLLDRADTAAAAAGLVVGASLPATATSARSSGSDRSPA